MDKEGSKMTVKAVGTNVIVRLKKTMVSKGGIELPFGTSEVAMGIVESIGEDVNYTFSFEEKPRPPRFRDGDLVVISSQAKITSLAPDLWIVDENDIVGVVVE